jgi:membrane-associated HD superfamily phosphohydrolase
MAKPRASNSDTRSIAALRAARRLFHLPYFLPLPLLVLVGTVVIILFLFPYTSSFQSLNLPKIGEVSKETIISPFTFDIIRSPDELERERKKAEEQVLLVLQYDVDNRTEIRKKFADVREAVNALTRKNSSDSVKTDNMTLIKKFFLIFLNPPFYTKICKLK